LNEEGSAENSWAGAFGEEYLTKPLQQDGEYVLDNMLLTNIANNPQYASIKNDIVAIGQMSGSKLEIRYHLIIDNKPDPEWTT
jgi:hypothetical protein